MSHIEVYSSGMVVIEAREFDTHWGAIEYGYRMLKDNDRADSVQVYIGKEVLCELQKTRYTDGDCAIFIDLPEKG